MKRLSGDPAVRLAECRGEPVPPAGEVEFLMKRATELKAERDALQSELTKAGELLALQSKVIEFATIIDKQAFAKGTQNVGVTAFRAMGDALSDLAHKSAPAAKGGE